MRTILFQEVLAGSMQRVKAAAEKSTWDGGVITPYFESCKWWIEKHDCCIIYTKDTGHHTCGWWKNPDYERCYHLSISFPGGKKKAVVEKLVDYLFGQHKKWIWVEPPYSETGKRLDVWHYRLFCNAMWQPIKPRGEVYSTELTEAGWKSYSELHGKPFNK